MVTALGTVAEPDRVSLWVALIFCEYRWPVTAAGLANYAQDLRYP